MLCEVREDFSVEFYVFLLERRDERTILRAGFSACGVYAYVPKTAKHSFLLLAAAEFSGERVKQGLLGGALLGFPPPAEALCKFEQLLSFLVSDGSSFYPWHIICAGNPGMRISSEPAKTLFGSIERIRSFGPRFLVV